MDSDNFVSHKTRLQEAVVEVVLLFDCYWIFQQALAKI